MTRPNKWRGCLGDFVCGTIGGALATYTLAGAVVVLLTGRTLPLLPTLLCAAADDVKGSIMARLMLATCYVGIACGAFICFRFVQELLRGQRWRHALAGARRLPSIW